MFIGQPCRGFTVLAHSSRNASRGVQDLEQLGSGCTFWSVPGLMIDVNLHIYGQHPGRTDASPFRNGRIPSAGPQVVPDFGADAPRFPRTALEHSYHLCQIDLRLYRFSETLERSSDRNVG